MTPSTTRRRVLATVPLLALGAGCTDALSFGEDSSPRVGLGAIRVLNRRETQTAVELTVLRDGEQVYEQTHTLDGTEGNRVGSVKLVESWMGQRVPYDITVTAQDPRVDAALSTSDADQFFEDWGENDCLNVHFDITSETIHTALGGLNDCPSPPSGSATRNGTADARR